MRLCVLGGLLVASLAMNVVTAVDLDRLVEATVARDAQQPVNPTSSLGVDEETARQLASLGYAPYVRVDHDENRVGVDLHEAQRSAPGLNVAFAEWGCKQIEFFRNDGTLVRTFDVSALPNDECYSIKPVENGFVFLARPNLFSLDLQGKVRWRILDAFHFHHDFDANESEIIALDKITIDDPDGSGSQIYDDRLVVISPEGRVRKIVSLHDLFWDEFRAHARKLGVSPFDENAVEVIGLDFPGDFYHANSVQILDHDSPIGRAGQVLVSLRTIDTIATIDLDQERVVWSMGPGIFDHQHHPTLLENGHILVFDNGWHRGYSRVIEIDPVTSEIVWQYAPESADVLFTKRRGSAYRLSNGNTLITESDRGRAFEITPAGETVWQYWMPLDSSHPNVKERLTLFRLQRMSGEPLQHLLDAWNMKAKG